MLIKLNHHDLFAIYGTPPPKKKTTEYTFLASAHQIFSTTGHILAHKKSQ